MVFSHSTVKWLISTSTVSISNKWKVIIWRSNKHYHTHTHTRPGPFNFFDKLLVINAYCKIRFSFLRSIHFSFSPSWFCIVFMFYFAFLSNPIFIEPGHIYSALSVSRLRFFLFYFFLLTWILMADLINYLFYLNNIFDRKWDRFI